MDTTITLDAKHYKAAERKARKLGTTPGQYIHTLIEADQRTFDAILAPVREGFVASGVSEEELDEAVTKARKAIHRRENRPGKAQRATRS